MKHLPEDCGSPFPADTREGVAHQGPADLNDAWTQAVSKASNSGNTLSVNECLRQEVEKEKAFGYRVLAQVQGETAPTVDVSVNPKFL